MGNSASSINGGSVKSVTPNSGSSSKASTPGPRPYSAHYKKLQMEQSRTTLSKLSNNSKLSHYKTPLAYEDIDNYRSEMLQSNQSNFLTLSARQALEKFLEIQYKLDVLDEDAVIEGLKSVENDFQIVQASKMEAENIYKTLYDQNQKETVNDFFVPTVQSFYVNRKLADPPMTASQTEYLQNLNLLEIAENEFRQVNTQYNNSKKIHTVYKKEYKTVMKLRTEQMNILYSVFQGDYGSEAEERLENEIMMLTENKDQLKSALIKLVHSRSLIIYSYNKLQCSEDKWIELINCTTGNKEKVFFATEVRNNLAGAYHYLNNTRSYLKNEDMPYCADQDLKNLLYQAASVYQDMNTLEAQRITLKNIQVMRKRCLALSHWFETVIKMFIPLMTQYSIVSAQYDQKKEQLKFERISMLNNMIRQAGGQMIYVEAKPEPSQGVVDGTNLDPLERTNIEGLLADKSDKNTSKKKVSSKNKGNQDPQKQQEGNSKITVLDNRESNASRTNNISNTIVPLAVESEQLLQKSLTKDDASSVFNRSFNASISSAMSKRTGTRTMNLHQLTSSKGLNKQSKSIDSNSVLESVSLTDNGQMTFLNLNGTKKMQQNGTEDGDKRNNNGRASFVSVSSTRKMLGSEENEEEINSSQKASVNTNLAKKMHSSESGESEDGANSGQMDLVNTNPARKMQSTESEESEEGNHGGENGNTTRVIMQSSESGDSEDDANDDHTALVNSNKTRKTQKNSQNSTRNLLHSESHEGKKGASKGLVNPKTMNKLQNNRQNSTRKMHHNESDEESEEDIDTKNRSSMPINSNESAELVFIKRRAPSKMTSKSNKNYTNDATQSMVNDEMVNKRDRSVRHSKKYSGSLNNMNTLNGDVKKPTSRGNRSDSVKRSDKASRIERSDSHQKPDKASRLPRSDSTQKQEKHEKKERHKQRKAGLKHMNSIEVREKRHGGGSRDNAGADDDDIEDRQEENVKRNYRLKQKNILRYEMDYKRNMVCAKNMDGTTEWEANLDNYGKELNWSQRGNFPSTEEVLIDKPPIPENARLRREITDVNFLKSRYKSNPLLNTLINTEDDGFGLIEPARPASRYHALNLPLPPSRDQILVDVEQIKNRFKQQEEEWGLLLNQSRQNADDRLNTILLSHDKTRFYK